MDKKEKLKIIKNAIGSYPDFPKPGIIFRDVFGILKNITALRALKDLMVEHVLFLEVDIIVGLDSRGFLFGPLISIELGKPFIPIRKQGKLPGKVVSQAYSLEYGEAVFEIQMDKLNAGTRVLVVDDLLATGGSMAAAVKLLKLIGTTVVECLVVIELTSLRGREKIDTPVHSIVQYD